MNGRNRLILASLIIVHDETPKGIFVLLHRRFNTRYHDGYYDVPSGHVESGEMPNLAAARELEEETGLKCDPNDLEMFFVVNNEIESPGKPYMYMFFRIDRKKCKGTYRINEPNKSDKMAMFSIDNLPKPITPSVEIALGQIKSNVVKFLMITPDILGSN